MARAAAALAPPFRGASAPSSGRVRLESEDAHRAYYSQPAHQAFSEWVFARNCEVIRVDYPLDGRSLMLG